MLRQVKREIKRVLIKLPFFDNYFERRKFVTERDLIQGKSHNVSDHRSIIHYSVNKAATQYTQGILLQCAEENNLLPVRMSAYAWSFDFPYIFTLPKEELGPYYHIFKPKGYLYTVFGGLVEEVPNVDQYNVVVMIRDPRDVLVSEYFSYGFKHDAPRVKEKQAEFYQLRDHIKSITIDEYVLENAGRLQKELEKYVNFRKQHPNTLLLRYEDMINDFPSWLDRLIEYCQLNVSKELKQKLIETSAKSSRKTENLASHRRAVTPGDHVKKLEPKTIEQLNEIFKDVFSELGYEVESS